MSKANAPATERALQRNQENIYASGVRIKSIALPAEHGGWALLFEPIALGVLLAPSVAGAYLALGALGFFLTRQPLTIAIATRNRPSPRATIARQFVFLYLALGSFALLAAIAFGQNQFLWPLVIAAPLLIVQVAHDWAGHRRALVSEIAGAAAVSSLAAMITLAGGWPIRPAFALWAIMTARAVPAILYVRACVARLRRRPTSCSSMLVAHLLAVVAVATLAGVHLAPRVAVAATIVLLVRAIIGFARVSHLTAKQLGLSEVAFGTFTVVVIGVGKAFGW